MARKRYAPPQNKAAGSPPLFIEPLERRTLLSVNTATVVGFLPDYNYTAALMTTLENAHFEGLTQINYFSVIPTTGGLLPGTTVGSKTNTSTTSSSGFSLVGASSQLSQIVAAAHADGLKVDIVIGGAGGLSTNLGDVVESGSTTTWQTFAASVQQFVTAHGLDGIDLDWEPASLATNDTTDYGGLIAALRQDTSGITISADVNAEQLQVAGGGSAYELNATGIKDLNSINVMAYDLEPGNVSPTGEAESDLAGWGTYVQANGGSKSELLFGMPFYGTSGTTWANTQALTYANIISDYGSLPSPSANSVVIDGATWNYNGPNTIAAKTAYSLDNGYGGVAIWEISQDYFTSGGAYDPTYSLLPQIQKSVASNTAQISGTVSNNSSAGVAGVTVYLDTNNNGQLDPGELSTTTGSSGTYTFSDLLPGTYEVREVVPAGYVQTSPTNAGGLSVAVSAGQTAIGENFIVAPVTVANEYLFYYGSSAFDGSATSPSSADQNAVATDKSALVSGPTATTATFSNISSYADGINGILIDFANMPAGVTFSASDFQFKVGSTSNSSTWSTAPAPTAIATWTGSNGDTFADIVWANNAISEEWLQVTVLADANTHLASNFVFYYGSEIGATGISTATTGNGPVIRVTSADVVATQNNASLLQSVPITNLYDFNRDGKVTAADIVLCQNNTTLLGGLELITVGGSSGNVVTGGSKSKTTSAAASHPSASVSSNSATDQSPTASLLNQQVDVLGRTPKHHE